ncbi:MAG: sulfatase, partial [Planctomycetota bacterium]
MSDDLPAAHPSSRLVGALTLGATCGLLGVWMGAVEGRWIAYSESFPVDPFAPELIVIVVHYLVLFGCLGLLLGLARRWQRPQAVLCGLAMLATIWILPYRSPSTTVTVVGLVVMAACCRLYLSAGPRLRATYLLADAALALALLAGIPATSTPPPDALAGGPARLPNIVVVVIDTLRADHLSCYGYSPGEDSISPVLDGLAAAGTRFDKAYAQAPWTRPSTASLFTGLYPASHGIVTPYDPLGADLPTIATMLRSRGYRTVGFSANPQIAPAFGFHHGFQRFWNSTVHIESLSAGVRLARKLGIGSAPPPLRRGVHDSTADDVNRKVIRWLQSAPEDAPTFLYVHYLDPHDPYSAPEDLLDVPEVSIVDEGPLYASQDLPPFPIEGSTLPGLDPAQMAELQLRYDNEIAFVDDRLGHLLLELRASGMLGAEDYLVITS